MVNVGIVGASGYVGGELLRFLMFHPEVEIDFASSREFVGKQLHKVHPNLRNVSGLSFTVFNLGNLDSDIVFMATPHGTSMNVTPKILEKGVRVIDLSADFRLKNPNDYRRWYGVEHKCPELLKEAVQGLPELHRDRIKDARLVACLGCISTSAILGLAPIIKAGSIEGERIVVDSKVGSSATGGRPSLSSHHPERAGVVRAYKVVGHRHTAEIEQELNSLSDKEVKVFLSSHAVDIVRGILSTIHVFLTNFLEDKDVWKMYRSFYKNEPFIRIFREKKGIYRLPDPKVVVGTNFCDLGFELDPHGDRLVVLSAIDNLVKGAAGQAVQSMNIMLGIDEKTGLKFPGLHPV